MCESCGIEALELRPQNMILLCISNHVEEVPTTAIAVDYPALLSQEGLRDLVQKIPNSQQYYTFISLLLR